MEIQFEIDDKSVRLNKVLLVTYPKGKGTYNSVTKEFIYEPLTFYGGTFGSSQEHLIYDRIIKICKREMEREYKK